MVPPAVTTDLHDIDAELPKLMGHRLELFQALDPPGVLPKLLAKGVVEFHQRLLAADRAGSVGGQAMELGGAQ